MESETKVTYDDSGIIEGANGIIKAGESLANSIEELLTGSFTVWEVFDVLGALIRSAEALMPDRGVGQIKHQLVRQVFNDLDEKYHMIDAIDAAIPAPWFLEAVDGIIIRKSIDLFIILTVTLLNSTGVFKK